DHHDADLGKRRGPAGEDERPNSVNGPRHRIELRQDGHPRRHGPSGTSAVLRKIIGSDRKPSIEKKSPWLFTEKARAIEMAVRPTPNKSPIRMITTTPPKPVTGCTPNRYATPRITRTCSEVIVMTNRNRLITTDVREIG